MKQNSMIALHSFPVWLPQTQTWMYNQVKYLPGTVHVHVVCERTENLDQFQVPDLHSLYDVSHLRYFLEKGLRKVFQPQYRGFLESTARRLQAQILHSHFGNIGWMDLDAAKRSGMKHVVTFYGYDVNMLPRQDKKWQSRYQELFEKADLFLCEGPYMAGDLISFGAPKEKVKVHHLGIEIDNIPYRPRQWNGGEPLRVLIIAAFQEKKGIPYALEALAMIQHFVPMEITIIGDAVSQPRSMKEKQRILEVIEKGDLRSKTRMLGFQPYSVIFDEAFKHHIFISPSVTASDGDTEGGAPVTLIEMIASGMPVVSTTHCDIPEVVRYGIHDWLVPEFDVNGLVEKLQWLINHYAEWNNFLMNGRRHVEIEYSAIKQGERLARLYHEAVIH